MLNPIRRLTSWLAGSRRALAVQAPARLLNSMVEVRSGPDVTVGRILADKLHTEADIAEFETALFQAVESGTRCIILDLTQVKFMSSAVIGTLARARRKLMHRGEVFQPPCRRRGLFAFYPNEAAALKAIRQGESDPLLLCSVDPNLMDVFKVC